MADSRILPARSPQRGSFRLPGLLAWSTAGARPRAPRLKRRELTYLLRNLSTLSENGLPLARAVAVLAQERSLRRLAKPLADVQRQLEQGQSFSTALTALGSAFDEVTLCQIRGGERSGTLPATLELVSRQVEEADQIRATVIRKLAYPLVLVVAGIAAVTFMLLVVIPIFDRTYSEAGVPLPWITRFLVAVADLAVGYGWIVPAVLAPSAIAYVQARKSPAAAEAIDRALLRLPLLGDWLRNLVVLQFMNVLGNLLESGFKVVESLEVARGAVGNAAIRRSVRELEAAVRRGERFSREIDNLADLFPPVVGQLIVVGERTGSLAKATAAIRRHLRREIDQQTNLMVGVLEPTLTIGLSVMIGVILLAIYLPMFDMIGAMNAH